MPTNNLQENLTNLSNSPGYKKFLGMPLIGSVVSKNKNKQTSEKVNKENILVPKKLLQKIFSVSQENKEIPPVQAFNSNSDILKNVYKVMRLDHDTFMKNMIEDRKFNKKVEKLKESRTKELIDALSGKKIEKERKKQVKKEIEQLQKKLKELEEKGKKPEGAPAPATAPAPAPAAPGKPNAAPAPAPKVDKTADKAAADKAAADKAAKDKTTSDKAAADKAAADKAAADKVKRDSIEKAEREAAQKKTEQEAKRKAEDEAKRKAEQTAQRSPEAVTPAQTATRAPESAVPPATAISAGKAAAVMGGITLSSAAIATIKSEQGVKSAQDAISPNNDSKRVKKGEFADITTPKVGAATPDTGNSTSYGLFGINNIRSIDKKTGEPITGTSSIDRFVKNFPDLKLPDPGDPKNPQQVKAFNEAWWNLAKNKPVELFAAQMRYFKEKFEDPAAAALKGKTLDEISNDQKVKDFMTDRRVQFGAAMLNSAMAYAKNAKTPEEFINLITEHDFKNLRQIFTSTSDEEFKSLKVGLIKRLRDRQITATGKSFIPDTVKEKEKVLSIDVGEKLHAASRENKDLKQQSSTPSGPRIAVLNTNNNINNGSNIYEAPTENKHSSPALANQYK